jgi:hypothetical protein
MAVAVFYNTARYQEPKAQMRRHGEVYDRQTKTYIGHWTGQPKGKP